MNLVASDPGGSDVVKFLHSKKGLSHNLTYNQIEKIYWSQSRGKWMLIKGAKGVGAIKATINGYEAVASTGSNDVDEFRDSKGSNVLSFIKGKIGKLQKFYMARDSNDVRTKQQKRAGFKQGVDPGEVDRETLVKKFKPVWVRAMTAAIADIKGHVATMIKNDAYSKAMIKLKYLESLQDSLEQLELDNGNTPQLIRMSVQTAIYMSASHYYPEQTGNITRSYGDVYSTQFQEGPRQLLKDIAEGDIKKLGTVLGFFKKAVISR